MKRWLNIKSLIISIFMCCSVIANYSYGDYEFLPDKNITFHHPETQINIEYLSSWKKQAIKKPSVLSLVDTLNMATINVLSFKMAETVTVNGFQIKRKVALFDGWINILEREGSLFENNSANVLDSYLAVYTKEHLDEDLRVNTMMQAEYYYRVSSRNVIVVSIILPKKNWVTIKDNFKAFIESFWIGQGSRPLVEQTVYNKVIFDYGSDWTDRGGGKNNYFINASPSIFKQKNIWWEKSLDFINISTDNEPLVIQDVFYYGYSNKLHAINLLNGSSLWAFEIEGSLSSNMLFNDGVINYIEQVGKDTYLVGIFAHNGSIFYRKKIEDTEIYSITLADLYIYGLDLKGRLVQFDKASGEIIGDVSGFSSVMRPLYRNGTLVILNQDNELLALDANNHNLIWKHSFEETLLFQPSFSNDYIICVSGKKESKVKVLSMNSGEKEWEFSNDFLQVDSSISPLVGNGALFLVLEEGESSVSFNRYLSSFELKTGSFLWKTKLINKDKANYVQPILTNEAIFLSKDEANEMEGLDFNTGEQIKINFKINKAIDNQKNKVFFILPYKDKILSLSNNKKQLKIKLFD